MAKLPLMTAAAALALLAGCSSSKSTTATSSSASPSQSASSPAAPTSGTNSGGGTSPSNSSASSAGSSAATPSTSSASATKTPPAAAGGTTKIDDTYYNVKVGNSLTYRVGLGAGGTATYTETVTKVLAVPGGHNVTFSRAYKYSNPKFKNFTSVEIYTFHDDGSLSVPYQPPVQSATSKVKVLAGDVHFPTPAQFKAGTTRSGTIRLAITVTGVGHAYPAAADITVRGAGPATVTVPTGTYHARILDEQVVVHVAGQTQTVPVRNWMVKGVGPVKSTFAEAGQSFTAVLIAVHRA